MPKWICHSGDYVKLSILNCIYRLPRATLSKSDLFKSTFTLLLHLRMCGNVILCMRKNKIWIFSYLYFLGWPNLPSSLAMEFFFFPTEHELRHTYWNELKLPFSDSPIAPSVSWKSCPLFPVSSQPDGSVSSEPNVSGNNQFEAWQLRLVLAITFAGIPGAVSTLFFLIYHLQDSKTNHCKLENY